MRRNKLHGNGRWESTGFFVPELREKYASRPRDYETRKPPNYDEQYADELSGIILDAMDSGETVVVDVFGVFKDEIHTGVIEDIDAYRRLLKLVSDGEVVWIPLADIVKVEKSMKV